MRGASSRRQGSPRDGRRRSRAPTPLRPVERQRVAGHEVEDRLGDVGGVVADALDVLRAEQEVRAERDVARILHHEGQEVAEHRILQRVEFARRASRPPGRARRRAAHRRRARPSAASAASSFMCFRPIMARGRRGSVAILTARLAMFLARSPTRSRSPETRIAATISRRSTAIGWRRAMVRIALSSISRCRSVEPRVAGDDRAGEVDVESRQRVHRVGQHLLGDAAHFGDLAAERFEFLVVGLDDVVGHDGVLGPRGSAEPAGDVVLRLLLLRRREDASSCRRTRSVRRDT